MLKIGQCSLVSLALVLAAGCGSSSGGSTGTSATGAGGDGSSGAGGASAGPGGGGTTGKGGAGGSGAGAGAAGGASPGAGGATPGAGGATMGTGGAAAGGAAQGGAPATGGAGGASAAGGSAGGTASGTTIMGSFMGMPFTTAPTALWIGMPDSNQTEVVYVFSNPVDCATLGAAGWDAKIPNNTQVLEMKEFGTSPAAYTVVKSATPKAGEASVNHTLSKTTPPSAESPGTAGTVTIATINAGKNITGSFDVKFNADALTGTFDATFCPGGVEP